jgi:hypothetical protein
MEPMNFTSTLPSYRDEVATAKEAVRRRLELAGRKHAAYESGQTLTAVAGSGIALGLGLLALNRLGIFQSVGFGRHRMNRYALYAAAQQLAAMPREIGARMGLVKRKPRTFRHRIASWLGGAAGNLDYARHRVGDVGGSAYRTVRDGLHDTRIESTRLVREHPAASIGAGLLTAGLVTAAIIAPSYFGNDGAN